jgi:hypothetical protein
MPSSGPTRRLNGCGRCSGSKRRIRRSSCPTPIWSWPCASARSAPSYNGQRCTALKILFVHQSVLPDFLDRMSRAVEGLRPGMPWDDGVTITPLPDLAQVRKRGRQGASGQPRPRLTHRPGAQEQLPEHRFHPLQDRALVYVACIKLSANPASASTHCPRTLKPAPAANSSIWRQTASVAGRSSAPGAGDYAGHTGVDPYVPRAGR